MAWTNNMFKLITPFLEEIQEIEYVLRSLKYDRSLITASGQQLDGLGDILNVDRNGLSDTDYRVQLNLKIILNTASGDAETVIAYVKSITASTNVLFQETYPAGVRIEVNGSDTLVLGSDLKQLVEAILPAAVKINIIYVDPAFSPFTFGFEGGYTPDGEGYLELGYPEIPNGYVAGAHSEFII